MSFKFAAPITTIAGNSYRVEVATSVAASVLFYRKSATASDWTFGLRTTAAQAPAAGDQILVHGDYTGPGASSTYTVTIDASSTIGTSTAGQTALEVSAKGVLSWSTGASLALTMTLNGDLYVNHDGALNVGTLAVPVPSTSTATIIFNVAVNVAYGLTVRGNGSLTSYGVTKTTKAYLTANVIAGGTSLTTSVSTGWASGDVLAVASTSRLVAECEQVTMSGAASGSAVPVSALSFNHDGSALSNVAKAEIINLTRNVIIKGVSTTLQTYILAQNNAQIVMGYTDFQFMGSATGGLRGFEIQSTGGNAAITGCSFRNFEVTNSIGVYSNSLTPATLNVQNCVFYRIANTAVLTLASNTTSLTLNDCWAIGGTGMFQTAAYSIPSNIGVFTNLNAAGASGTQGVIFNGTALATGFTCSNLVTHSHTATNLVISVSSDQTTTAAVFTGIVSYRSTADGINFNTTQNVLMDTVYAFGNTSRGITYTLAFSITLKNVVIYSETIYAQTSGIVFNNHSDSLIIENGTIGVLGAHPTADINDVCPRNQHNLVLRNVTCGSSTISSGQGNYTIKSYTAFAKLNGSEGSHRTYYKYGVLSSDSTFFQTLSPSVRMSPNSATQKFQGAIKTVAVPSGKSVRVGVWVRKSVIGDGTTYNGNEVELLVLGNAACGVSNDTILATTSVASNGAFELIRGTTVAVTDNVALQFLVQCDGTLGWINADRWVVEIV
jgi:hypothetical protein